MFVTSSCGQREKTANAREGQPLPLELCAFFCLLRPYLPLCLSTIAARIIVLCVSFFPLVLAWAFTTEFLPLFNA